MNFYYLAPNQSYLLGLANFILKNYAECLNEVIVLLPNGKACLKLKYEIAKHWQQSACILPQIIPINEISLANNGIIHLDKLQLASSYDHKFILSKIIASYPDYNFTITKALELSDSLLELFREFVVEDINLTRIPYLSLDQAEHWQILSKFLIFAYHKWREELAKLHKTDLLIHYKDTLAKLVDCINSGTYQQALIIAGITDKIAYRLLKVVAGYSQGSVILPAFYPPNQKTWENIKPGYPLQAIKQLLDYCNVDLNCIKPIVNIDQLFINIASNDLGGLFCNNKPIPMKNEIKCYVVPNQLQEAELIKNIVLDFLARTRTKSIAIVTDNAQLVELCSNLLKLHNIILSNFVGSSLSHDLVIQFILALANLYNPECSVQLLLQLLKHPYLLDEHVYLLEHLLINNRLTITTYNEILNYLAAQSSSWQMKCEFIKEIINYNVKIEALFTKLLTLNLQVAEKLYPELWSIEVNIPVGDYLRDLLASSFILGHIEVQSYAQILKLLVEKRISDEVEDLAQVIAIKPSDSVFIQTEAMIIPEFNEGSWPKSLKVDPWLGSQIRVALNLSDQYSTLEQYYYYFYNLLYCLELYLIRPTKSIGLSTEPSRFWLKLLNLTNIEVKYFTSAVVNYAPAFLDKKFKLSKEERDLPKKISATNIELLLRNPYGYYAKKILNLKKLERFNHLPNLIDFGNFIHKVIELYTLNYQIQPTNIQHQKFLDLGWELFNKQSLTSQTLWWYKFKHIALEFVIFDQKRRDEASEIYAEQYGEMVVELSQCRQIVTAIADRIEVNPSKKQVYIIDYKTGTIPSRKEINSGLSPQLILEALIASRGGFKCMPAIIPTKLCYVKLASTSPYWRLTEIPITFSFLERHLQGLRQLLEFFISSGLYIARPNEDYAPSYDDYKHLSRVDD